MRRLTITSSSVTLLSPNNGAEVSIYNPGFTGSALDGVLVYQLQVTPGTNFGNHILDVQTTTATYDAVFFLPQGTFSWRVQARASNHEWMPWSELPSFTTRTPSVQMTSPADNAKVSGIEPALAWSGTLYALAYHVQVDDQGDFSSPLTNRQTGLTSTRLYPPGATTCRTTGACAVCSKTVNTARGRQPAD